MSAEAFVSMGGVLCAGAGVLIVRRSVSVWRAVSLQDRFVDEKLFQNLVGGVCLCVLGAGLSIWALLSGLR